MDRYIGRLLDNRYEILEIIGTGGMAVVYKARCHRLNRLVAVKILKDEFSRDEEFRRRFHAEGEAVAMLSHPNIVQVYDVSSSDNADYIVMELIDGITLKQYMEKKGTLNWKETLHFSLQIAKALEHAHGRSIVHRDIKPHNVMVLKNGSVKVTDFGIARVMSKSNTLTKEALGSVHYISPEQAKGGWVDNRSDLYSLSVVMYEMMTGRPPYDGESPVAVAIQHINGGAPMPSTLNPNIPGGLEQIIMKGMALEAKDRYASATEMLKDMEEFRKNPSMLFDYQKPGAMDDATVVLDTPVVQEMANHAKSTAERKAGSEGAAVAAHRPRPAPRPNAAARNTGAIPDRNSGRVAPVNSDEAARRARAQAKRRQEQQEMERSRNKSTTIAVVVSSVVAIVAITVFLIALLSGSLSDRKALVTIPNMVGEFYENLPAYEGFKVSILEMKNSDTVEKGKIMEQTIMPNSKVEQGTLVQVTVSMGPETQAKTMDNLVDMFQEDAEQWLKDMKLVPKIRKEASDEFEEGKVIRTDPAKGEKLTDGQTITLYVSTGAKVQKAKVPKVEGRSLKDAEKVLNERGFTTIDYEYKDSDRPKDEVIKQSAVANQEIDVTTPIVLTISKGPAPTEAPTVAPTQKPTEKPTDPPEATDPKVVQVNWPFDLPLDRDGEYVVEIYHNGKRVSGPVTVQGGTAVYTATLTGSGVQYFDLYIDHKPFKEHIAVEFS